MGIRFRKSKNIGPFRVTLSKSGISTSVGVKGFRVTKTANGRIRTTASIPGTGISYVKDTSWKNAPSTPKVYPSPIAESGSKKSNVQGGMTEKKKKSQRIVPIVGIASLLLITAISAGRKESTTSVMVSPTVPALISEAQETPYIESTPLITFSDVAETDELLEAPDISRDLPMEDSTEGTEPVAEEIVAEESVVEEPVVEEILAERAIVAETTVEETTAEETAVEETTAEETTAEETTAEETEKEELPEPVGFAYVLNTNTKKFHNPGCSSVKDIKDSNRQDITATREEILAMGYSPCGRCHP